MAKSLDAILKELDAGYNPGREMVNQRLKALPGEAANEIGALKAQEQDYFDNTIMGGARERGLGFSGIPEGERARYGATEYLPAIARVKQAQEGTRMSLLSSLNDINLDQRKTALGYRQQELDREEQRRQFERQLAAQERASRRAAAAARASAMPTLGNLGGGGGMAAAQPGARMGQRADKGFDFVDSRGKAISAARYAQLTNTPLGEVLYSMGQAGDEYAQQLYNQMRGNQKLLANGIPNNWKATYSPIFWGT